MSISNEQVSHQIDSLVNARDMLRNARDMLRASLDTLQELDDIATKEQEERRRLASKGTLVI